MFLTQLYIKLKTLWEVITFPQKYYAKKYAKKYVTEYIEQSKNN